MKNVLGNPARPHILRGHGRGREIAVLRSQVEALAEKTSAAATLVYAPGYDPSYYVDKPNVFATWEETMTARNGITGRVVIEVDDWQDTPYIEGEWDLRDTVLCGMRRDSSPIFWQNRSSLTIGNATLYNLNEIEGLDVWFVGNAPAIVVGSEDCYVLSLKNATIYTDTNAFSFIRVEHLGYVYFRLAENSSFVNDWDCPIVSANSGDSASYFFFLSGTGTELGSYILGGDTASAFVGLDPNTYVDLDQSDYGFNPAALYLAYVAYSGYISVDLSTGNWDGVPGDVNEAIERLASAVAGLLSGVIP